MGNFNFINLLITLVILYFLGFLIYKIVKKIMHSTNHRIKELESKINKLEQKK